MTSVFKLLPSFLFSLSTPAIKDLFYTWMSNKALYMILAALSRGVKCSKLKSYTVCCEYPRFNGTFFFHENYCYQQNIDIFYVILIRNLFYHIVKPRKLETVIR
jgi:hypothetical protein